MKKRTSSSLIKGILIIFSFLAIQTRAQVVLYGLTSAGGANDTGTLFSITPSGNIVVVASLNATFAAVPEGSLLYASDGNFYASSVFGGYQDSCTIFRCTPLGILKTMINLDSVWDNNGAAPTGNSLIQALDSNLYGMTTFGGPNDSGVLFKLQLSGYYSAVHFFNPANGAIPCGSLIQTSDSNLWGMTSQGGMYGCGTIFHCTPSGIFTSVFNFDTLDGMEPHGDLVLANDGNFYGLTLLGGMNGMGVLFRYNPSGIFTKLVDFNYTNGAGSYGSLIQASDGNLYGLTAVGGDSGLGTLFSCTLSGNLTTLVSFNDSNGANPYGTLIEASDGYLYGMASAGGKYNYGTVFQCSLSGYLIKLADFNYTNGAIPMFGKLIEVDNLTTASGKIKNTNFPVIFPNPNQGLFTVLLSDANNLPLIEIYNIMGEQIKVEALRDKNTPINISNQPNGVYFYKIVSEDGGIFANGKFIIQK